VDDLQKKLSENADNDTQPIRGPEPIPPILSSKQFKTQIIIATGIIVVIFGVLAWYIINFINGG